MYFIWQGRNHTPTPSGITNCIFIYLWDIWFDRAEDAYVRYHIMQINVPPIEISCVLDPCPEIIPTNEDAKNAAGFSTGTYC